jgi:PAS domain S-box-containing protein
VLDVALESVRAAVLLAIVGYLWRVGRDRFDQTRNGWSLIVGGFGLLLFGSLLDISDNFEGLNFLVVVGDTEVEAILEKFVGFLGGFVVIAVGLMLWVPSVQRLNLEISERKQAEEALRRAHDRLETRVLERTNELRSEITERKAANESLRKSEARFRTLVEYAPEAITMLDVDTGLYLDANPMAEALHGLPRDELIGKLGPADLSPEIQLDGRPSSEAAPDYLSRALAGEFPRFEWMHLDPDGQETLCEVSLARLPDPHRNLVRASIFDITERKAAEEALRESEARLSKAAEMAKIGYWVWDEIEDMAVYCSDELAKMYGVASGADLVALTSSPAADLNWVHPEDRERVEQVIRTAKEKKRGFEIEHRIINLKGEIRNLHVIEEPVFDEQGRLIRSSGTTQDISERRAVEEAMLAVMNEAEIANRTKSEFLAIMSHELRTPLNAIIGFSEILKDETLCPVGSTTYRDYAFDINESGQHLLALINDILDLSKIQSGTDELHEESIDIPEIVNAVMKLVMGLAQTGNVELELDVSDDIPVLLADELKVKQILLNLLSNAIKFTPVGGKVTLKIWSRAKSGYVFQVIDTGIGIAFEDIPKALAPFQQVDSGLDRNHEGTGLGLPLAKSLVEMHGGYLDLQSEINLGTTVTVRFPAERIVELPRDTDSTDTAAKKVG